VHRVWNPGGAIRELARILRPGGTLFINVNNYSSIRRRLRFLFYGSIDNAVNDSQCRQTTDDPEAHVRLPICSPQLFGILESAGLTIEKVVAADVHLGHRLLAPLAWLIRAASLLVGPRSRRRNHICHANGPGLFPGGQYVLVVARKPK
jgi:SAM-dependent methyltransferase